MSNCVQNASTRPAEAHAPKSKPGEAKKISITDQNQTGAKSGPQEEESLLSHILKIQGRSKPHSKLLEVVQQDQGRSSNRESPQPSSETNNDQKEQLSSGFRVSLEPQNYSNAPGSNVGVFAQVQA